ncbi:MAG: hypothetical protein LBT01_05870 [Spirochaetaceae bacterium]|nr:hypothetical protein [Spirochaetaceae bacterium]
MIESTRTTKYKTTGKDKTTTERRFCLLTGASNPVSAAIRHGTHRVHFQIRGKSAGTMVVIQ